MRGCEYCGKNDLCCCSPLLLRHRRPLWLVVRFSGWYLHKYVFPLAQLVTKHEKGSEFFLMKKRQYRESNPCWQGRKRTHTEERALYPFALKKLRAYSLLVFCVPGIGGVSGTQPGNIPSWRQCSSFSQHPRSSHPVNEAAALRWRRMGACGWVGCGRARGEACG